MIFVTTFGLKPWSLACTRGPFIFIRPEYKDDKGIIEHEKVHRAQWLRTLGLHSFLYLFSKSYKLKAEVEAYRKQAEVQGLHNLPNFAKAIVKYYGLNVTEEEVLKLLQA